MKDDLLLPDDVVLGPNGWEPPKPRDFTTVGSFGATVQATFLASQVTRHILDTNRDLITRANDARKLDIALQSFIGSLIPPPYVILHRLMSSLNHQKTTRFPLPPSQCVGCS